MLAGAANRNADTDAHTVADANADLDARRADGDLHEHSNGDEHADSDKHTNRHAHTDTRGRAGDQRRRVAHVRVDVCGWRAVLGSE